MAGQVVSSAIIGATVSIMYSSAFDFLPGVEITSSLNFPYGLPTAYVLLATDLTLRYFRRYLENREDLQKTDEILASLVSRGSMGNLSYGQFFSKKLCNSGPDVVQSC
jgi:hypothetical protein